MFHLPSCTYGLTSAKLPTARGFVFGLTGSFKSITVETSFIGTKSKDDQLRLFYPVDLLTIGQELVQALAILYGSVVNC
jgi:hypothetical protein